MSKSERRMLDSMHRRFMNSMLNFSILKSISKRINTGYSISKKLREKHPKITTSLVYLNLNKLEQQGYLSYRVVHARIDRKEYTLTKKGRSLLKHLNENIRKVVELTVE